MPGSASNTQAVFLIDLSDCQHRGSKWNEAVSLCVFRTLCFLYSQLQSVDKTKTTVLRWGYKLIGIDEKVTKPRVGSTGFQDFKLKLFQAFEEHLKSCLRSAECTSPSAQSESVQTTKKSSESLHPALCLSKRLAEIMHDFPWDMPDLGSPVKGKKGHGLPEKTKFSNYVFLISQVPCDKKSLKYFCNKKDVPLDKNVFIDAVLPQMLRKQFCDQRKIQLHWIDTGRYVFDEASNNKAPSSKYYELVKKSLSKVGGVMIPFHALVTHLATTQTQGTVMGGEGSQTRGAPMEGEGREEDSMVDGKTMWKDEVASLLSYFACMSTCSALIPCWSRSRTQTAGQLFGAAATVTLTAALFFGQQGADGEECGTVRLKLIPIIQKAVTRTQTSGDPQQLMLSTEDGGDTACVLLRRSSQPHGHAPPQSTTHLHLKACMDKSQVRQMGDNFGEHFTCFVMNNTPGDQRQAFWSLLRTIHSRQQTLVLSVKVDTEPAPYLALLEASSLSTAQLTYLSLGLTLQVEKLIAMHTPWKEEVASSRSISLEEFKDRAANAIASRKSSEANLGQAEDVVKVKGDREGTNLWPGVLNPWHVAGTVPQIQSALDTLHDRSGTKSSLSKMERSVLYQLRRAYRQENQPLFEQNTPLFSSTSSFLPSSGSGDRSLSSRDDPITSASKRGHRCESILTRGRQTMIKVSSVASSSGVEDEVDGDFQLQVTDLVSPKPDITEADVREEEDLCQFVRQQYRRGVDDGGSLDPTLESLMSVILHFMTSQHPTCPQESTAKFLKENVLRTLAELKPEQPLPPPLPPPRSKDDEEEEEEEDDDYDDGQYREIKLQVLLHLEIESLCSSQDQRDQSERDQACEQIVEFLRFLLFTSGPKDIFKFFKKYVLNKYQATISDLLVTLYEELMLLPPSELTDSESPLRPSAGQSGDVVSDDSQSLTGTDDVSVSIASTSDQSCNSPRMRTRSSRYLCANMPGLKNSRVIEVPSRAKQAKGNKNKKGTKAKAKKEKSKSPGKKSPAKQHKGLKKARRNLFKTDICKAAPKPEDSQTSKSQGKKRHSSASSKQKGSKQTFVAETPHHRQRKPLPWKEEKRKQEEEEGISEVKVVVEESPYKDMGRVKMTPNQYKAPKRVLRRSFYSTDTSQPHSSKSFSQSMDFSDIISNQPQVSLEECPSAQMAVMKTSSSIVSPRRRISALLNPQTTAGHSPDLQCPALNTRSRTPQRLSQTKPLLEDARSMPALSSVAKILSFTSPHKFSSSEKQKTLPSATVISQTLTTSPRTGGFSMTLSLTDMPTKDTSRTPTKGNAAMSLLFTPTKQMKDIGCRTPTRIRPGTSCQATTTKQSKDGCRTPTRARAGIYHQTTPTKQTENVSCHAPKKCRERFNSTKLQFDSEEGTQSSITENEKAAISGVQKGVKRMTSPKKRSRGWEEGGKSVEGVSSAWGIGRSSSSSQESSLLQNVFPSHTVADTDMSASTTFLPLHSTSASELVHLEPRPRPSYTPTKNRHQDLLSAVGLLPKSVGTPTKSVSTPTKSALKKSVEYTTPTKAVHTPTKSVQWQQLLSSINTPTKPILRNSPVLHTSSIHSSTIRTPQKSPRVTFDIGQGGSQSVAGTSDSSKKSPRRKDQLSGNGGKSASSGSSVNKEGRSSHRPGRSSLVPTDTIVTHLAKQSALEESLSQGFSTISSDGGMLRKQNSSESDSVSSSHKRRRNDSFSFSPFKRQRIDSSAVAGISKPTLFSEDAVGGYFSASNEDMYLGCSAQPFSSSLASILGKQPGQASASSKQDSPRFGGKARGKRTLSHSDSGGFYIDANKGSLDYVGGSQGFDTVGIRIGDACEVNRPASPTFSTSPARKRLCLQKDKNYSGLVDRSVSYFNASSENKPLSIRDLQHKEATHIQHKEGTHTYHEESTHTIHKEGVVMLLEKNPLTPHTEGMHTPHKEGRRMPCREGAHTPHKEGKCSPHKEGTHTPHKGSTHRDVSGSVKASGNGNQTTPLRVKGQVTELKYSPNVSTSSLAQLMNSPLLLKNQQDPDSHLLGDQHHQADEEISSPSAKRSRKRLDM